MYSLAMERLNHPPLPGCVVWRIFGRPIPGSIVGRRCKPTSKYSHPDLTGTSILLGSFHPIPCRYSCRAVACQAPGYYPGAWLLKAVHQGKAYWIVMLKFWSTLTLDGHSESVTSTTKGKVPV